ncbi:ead/Ea22-like family protein [Klebsiella michiganensis]|uniref:ead/Ea22-like family protein n=1 Tax=Klebsiella michiganensis TaxID=1134687 RepID=UPI001CCD2C93|nr:ead/Ea22-like family protein [Klebsiella michiganensis]MBZ7211164.1 ead/Ea22-like family protein [Klebsiella michiganensis]
MTDITELAQSLKRRATSANEFGESLYVKADDVIALVEALELKEEQRANWFQMAQKLGEDLDAAEKRNSELESSVIAPDILRCTECSFVETKNIISVTADTITTGNSEPEPCPNGYGRLQPVTWKALAIQLMFTTKQGVSDLLEAKKRIAELEREQEHLRPVGVMSEKAFHRLENSECRFIALWPRPGIFLPRKRPEDGVIVYARTAAAADKVEAE